MMHYHTLRNRNCCATPCTAQRAPRNRQAGQGLLLAVLIMLLVALVGAAFVGVVALNLAQSARQEDRAKAVAMARAGIQFADEQLVKNPDWRPQDHFGDASQAAARTVPTLGYYDEVEIARGWNTGKLIKYPDPFNPNSTGADNPDFEGGRFLLEVNYPPVSPNGQPLPTSDPLSRYIQIHSIGRSINNPAVFEELWAYKANPLASNLLFITSKNDAGEADTSRTSVLGAPPEINFDAETMLAAAVSPGATEIFVRNKGAFVEDEWIVIGEGRDQEVVRIKMGNGVRNGDPSRIDLWNPTPITKNHPINTPVQKLTTDVIGADRVKTIFDGPIFVNCNLKWFGNTTLKLTSTRADQVQVAGLITSDTGASRDVRINLDGSDLASTTGDDIENSNTFTSIALNNLPLYQDARGRLANDTSLPDRWVTPIRPPVFVTGDVSTNNVKWIRFDELTRFSDNTRLSASNPITRGAAGFGKGIYINNFADLQYRTNRSDRINPAYPAGAKLLLDWLSATGADQDGDDNYGWVNHLEYVPPGVEIVLRKDDYEASSPLNSLGTQTYHTRNRAPHTPGRCVLWMKRDDTATSPWYRYDTGATVTQDWVSFDYPQNGVILAEGNVRIRGNLPKNTATNNYNLTVVSGGTIYIEGNILTPTDRGETFGAGESNSHIALLAKDHVCINATQFHHRRTDGVGVVDRDRSPVGSQQYQPFGMYEEAGNDSRWFLNEDDKFLSRDFAFGAPPAATTQLAIRYGGVMKVSYEGDAYPTCTVRVAPLGGNQKRIEGVAEDMGTPHENFERNLNSAPVIQLYELANWLNEPQRRGWWASDPLVDPVPPVDYDYRNEQSRLLAIHAVPINVRFWPLWLPLETDFRTTIRNSLGTPNLLAEQRITGDSSYPLPGRYITYPIQSDNVVIGDMGTIDFGVVNPPVQNEFRLCGFKFEQAETIGSYRYARQGMDITISALMYAQEGTFFIIPGVYFDDSTPTAGWNVLANRAKRFNELGDSSVLRRRFNYHIKIHGAVSQNYTADMNATNAYGLNSFFWTDKWSYPSFNGSYYEWKGIEYKYDPELRAATSSGLLAVPQLPLGEGLLYVG